MHGKRLNTMRVLIEADGKSLVTLKLPVCEPLVLQTGMTPDFYFCLLFLLHLFYEALHRIVLSRCRL